MSVFQQALDEIHQASYAEALEGGSAILVMVGAAVLKRLGLDPEGKADVKFEVDEVTTIKITWKPREEFSKST
jgi:hypothetical protein